MNTAYPRHQAAQPSSAPGLAQPGAATRLTANALGHSISAPPRGATFNHPWRPALSGSGITFRVATVQSLAGPQPIEPKIKLNGQLLPMSGKDGNTPTPLSLADATPNSDGVSWAALEVTPDAKGELQPDALVQIVHTNQPPISLLPTLGRCPIALILWQGKTPTRVLPIVHFNLRYYRILASAGDPTGAPKHLFL